MVTVGGAVDALLANALTATTAAVVAQIAGAIAIAFATFWARRLARAAVRDALARARVDPATRVVLDRVVQVGILLPGASLVAATFGMHLATLGAILGISGVAVGLALQDVLKQVIAGAYLMVERPFTLGDRVTVPAGTGTVRRIELMVTVIDLADRAIAVVPNAWFLSNAVTNLGPGPSVPVRIHATVRATHPDVADAHALRSAVLDCVARCPSFDEASRPRARVRAWTEVGPTVSVEAVVSDRSAVLDELAWAFRNRFGADLVEMGEA